MQLSSLLFSAKANISLGDALLDFVIVMVIVFLVLVVLIGIIYLMKAIFAIASNLKKEKEQTVSAPVDEKEIVTSCDEEEVAAVISAVLSLYYSDVCGSDKKAPFVVKKIYKIK